MTRVLPKHEVDPKQQLFDKYKDVVQDIPIYGPSLMVAIYQRPEKTKGGVIIPGSNLEEDFYQGKVGLVLKAGPMPLDIEDRQFFGDNPPKVGDWVVFKVSDGLSFGLLDRKGDCRFLKNRRSVLMTIEDPDLIW